MSSSSQNPFAQLFGQAPDFSKILEHIPQPSNFIDLEAAAKAQKDNAQAVSDALAAWSQGLQEIQSRNTQIATEAAQDATRLAKEALSGNPVDSKLAEQATSEAQKLYQRSMDNIREISEMAASINSEVSDILTKRAQEAVSEAQSLASKAGKKSAPKSSSKKAA